MSAHEESVVAPSAPAHDRLLRLREVLNRIPFSKSKWWDGVAKGTFPQPVYIDETPFWREAEIDALVQHGTPRKRPPRFRTRKAVAS